MAYSRKIASFSMIALVSVLIAVPASGQSTNGQSSGQNQGRSSSQKGEKVILNNFNCPITHVAAGCVPPRRFPKVASKQDCDCSVTLVKRGNKTVQVRDCYVQLPDDTIHFCRTPKS